MDRDEVEKLIEMKLDIQIACIQNLPLVLTNADLKKQFQISDSTLNRLINFGEFPQCWKGIRGHYSREDVLAWYRDKNFDKFARTLKEFRAM